MAIKFSTTVRNARLDSIESTIGSSPVLKVFTGSAPASCSDPDSGTLLTTCNLPVDWLLSASGGVKSKNGTWEDLSADGTGTAGYFRIYDALVATCHMQGSVTSSGGGGDMIVNNTSFASGQPFTINSFSLTEGGS